MIYHIYNIMHLLIHQCFLFFVISSSLLDLLQVLHTLYISFGIMQSHPSIISYISKHFTHIKVLLFSLLQILDLFFELHKKYKKGNCQMKVFLFLTQK